MKTVMQHMFSQVPQANIPRSSFDRSCGLKTTFDSGYLVPIFLDEALPGDTFNLRMTQFARLSTPLVPIMDNLRADTFFFAVPVRLVWPNWVKFNGEQANPGDSTAYTIPVNTAGSAYAISSLHDYMGLPTGQTNLLHNNLPLRCYNLIWNEWFRDENLQTRAVVDIDDGPDVNTDYVLKKRGKRHDYFTSALPWPQKGTAVTLPLGTSAVVYGTGKALGLTDGPHTSGLGTDGAGALAAYQGNYDVTIGTANSGGLLNFSKAIGVTQAGIYSGLATDLSTATSATINQLRQAFQIQRLYERDARGGTRYTEIVRSHFGVVSPDARLQRPEYLGGGSTPVTLHPIAQTSATGATGTPLGNLGAMGVMTPNQQGFTKSFTEHSYVLGLVSVRADLNYQQGLNKMWSRSTRWDFFWPALACIGEQAVLKQEIYCDVSATDDDVWGYQERYAEYRYKPSLITGKFRSTASGTLDVWHLAQKFASVPSLNSTFIEEAPPIARIQAVTSEPQFLYDAFFDLKCARPMPMYGVPGLIDHF